MGGVEIGTSLAKPFINKGVPMLLEPRDITPLVIMRRVMLLGVTAGVGVFFVLSMVAGTNFS